MVVCASEPLSTDSECANHDLSAEKKWGINHAALLPLRSTIHHYVPKHFLAILHGAQQSVTPSRLHRVETFILPEAGPPRVAPDTLSDIWTPSQSETGQRFVCLSQEASQVREISGGSSTVGIASMNARQFRHHCPNGVKITFCEGSSYEMDCILPRVYRKEAFQLPGYSTELDGLIRKSIADRADRVRTACSNNDQAVESVIGGWAQHCHLEATLLATLNDCLRSDYLRTKKLPPAVVQSLPLKFTQVNYVSERGSPTDYRSISTCFETRTW